MTEPELRRYLVNIESARMPQQVTDCLVVGAGIAGLRAAIEAAQSCQVVVLCKGSLEDSNTWLAQGGIASVLGSDDSFKSHTEDTLKAGCGLCDPNVVEYVVKKGPPLLKQLLDWGAEFDKEDGKIAATLEGGHSHARVAHAHGDETGRGIAEALIKKVRAGKNIRIIENFYVVDCLTDNQNRCIGIIGSNGRSRQIIWAKSTILASGGAGRLYRETTNPEVATADGLAIAYRAGATLQGLEFVQFHPTTLYIAGASRALVTETLRGEGAVLLDKDGKRFMPEYHEQAELAPRDIVSRAILEQMLKTNSTHVYLDVRHFDPEHFRRRFPRINELCESFDIDVNRDLIPVRPSAHYMIGGVKTDTSGLTIVENLYAAGEVASTGLHGANRLGSNSLLEGLVFGAEAGKAAAEAALKAGPLAPAAISYKIPRSSRTRLDAADVTNSPRALMWRNVGITRREQPLREAQEIISFWQRYVMDKVFETPTGWECQNMLTVAKLIAKAAQSRAESRGVHFRSDWPATNDADFHRQIELTAR